MITVVSPGTKAFEIFFLMFNKEEKRDFQKVLTAKIWPATICPLSDYNSPSTSKFFVCVKFTMLASYIQYIQYIHRSKCYNEIHINYATRVACDHGSLVEVS